MAEGGARAGHAAASSGPAAEAPPASAALRAVRAVVSGRTWLAVIHLLTGMVIGLAAFIIFVTGAVVGVVLLPFAFAGLPVLVADRKSVV